MNRCLVIKEISQTATNGTIEYYRLYKKVKAISGFTKEETFTFTSPQKYSKIVLAEENITSIIS